MPLKVLSAEEKKRADDAAETGLRFLLAEHSIDDDVQLVIFDAGFTTMRPFREGLQRAVWSSRRSSKMSSAWTQQLR